MLYLLLSLAMAVPANVNKPSVTNASLLELYSSEGCSSCPPAELAMYNLKSSQDLWIKFVPINFHVDYWNRLGWVDRFSNKKFTERQHEYAKTWQSNKVYTPAFVVDGVDKGSGLPKIENKKSKLLVSVDRVGLNFHLKTEGGDLSSYKVYAALLGNGLESKVSSGENKGETLKHNFVVVDLKEDVLKEKNNFSFPKPQIDAKSFSYAIWIADKNSLKVEFALGGDL